VHLKPLRRPGRAAAVAVGALALAGVTAAVAVGAARAERQARPASPSVSTLRSLADHFRRVTWEYERAARRPRTPTSFSYRRSSDRGYLEWTVARWSRRADQARRRALASIRRHLVVRLPPPPRPTAPTVRQLSYARTLAVDLRRIYPGHVTARYAEARSATALGGLRLWQERSAAAALSVSEHETATRARLEPSLLRAFLCIHHYEGAWNANTGNGYYGGLQMDWSFMRTYGARFVERWGSADNWPAWAQLDAAARALRSGRGFAPWPSTARLCGLL
jgi:hypothetical protein